jgi:Flp pilus assembly protein TadD
MSRGSPLRRSLSPQAVPRNGLPPVSVLTSLAIVAAALLAYSNALDAPFVFDSYHYVAANPSIRRLLPPWEWLAFAHARPVGYFTFALNWSVHQDHVFGYQLVNLLIHIAAGLLLAAVVRSTLRSERIPSALRERAPLLAATIALLWVVHPLGTQAVTYLYQRLESLAALGCLASLYAFQRYHDTRRIGWAVASVVACLAALLTKESAAALPLVVACYDRIFVAGGWRETFARRGRYYAALFACWAPLLTLVLAAAPSSSSSHYTAAATRSPLDYALTQPAVILHYLRLVAWPVGLCFDYGPSPALDLGSVFGPSLVLGGLVAATLYGLVHGRLWSFPAAAFFLLLAPSSSFVPVVDVQVEYRMYLPSACIIGLAVCGLTILASRAAGRIPASHDEQRASPFAPRAAAVAAIAAIGLLAFTTHRRNEVYASDLALWSDVVVRAPHNARAHASLGAAYRALGRRAEARALFERAVELDPYHTVGLVDLAETLIDEGRTAEAETLLDRAARSTPGFAPTLTMFGVLRSAQGRPADAVPYLEAALDSDPYSSAAMNQLGLVLVELNRDTEALSWFERACEIAPHDPAPRSNLAVVLCRHNRFAEAARWFRAALACDPDHQQARDNLALVLARLGS